MTIIEYIKNDLVGKLDNVLELGSGDQSDATKIVNYIGGKYFSIDKNDAEVSDAHLTFMRADYLDIKYLDEVIGNEKFSLIFSNYSLCFNKKEKIAQILPYYFDKIHSGGIFFVGDFAKDEKTVLKRTNLDSEWFYELIRSHFKSFTVLKKHVYEEAHGHNHSIFELIAHK
jgi:hypothetical protein